MFVALAVLFHLASWPVLEPLLPEAPPPGASRPRAHKVALLPRGKLPKLPSHKLDLMQETEKKKRPPPPEREKPDKPEEKLEGQVVDLPPSPDDRPPEEADYLSEHNTRTDRQTVSRNRTADYANAMNELARAKQAASPSDAPSSQAIEIGPPQPAEDKQQAAERREKAFELPTLKQRDRLALKPDPSLGALNNQAQSDAITGNSNRLKLDLGEDAPTPSRRGTAPNRGPSSIELMPQARVLARLNGAPANDHIEGIDEGEGTFLNSREFKYASFFNRLKQGVSQHWRPLDEYRRRDPSGNVYGQRARVTVLEITLDQEGVLQDVAVRKSSGVEFLDREAVAAFKRAEPFPNPPKGLIDNNSGLISFPFGFHIEFRRSAGLRLPF